MKSVPADDQTRSDLDQMTADREQTHSASDPTAADRDQGAADLDQLAADEDRAASDRDLAGGLGGDAHDGNRAARDRTRRPHLEAGLLGHDSALERDALARERDLAASERDRAAEGRDRDADEHDAETTRLTAGLEAELAVTEAQIILRAARDRQRAEADRARGAEHRAGAAGDREGAARDRQLSGDDRAGAAVERAAAAVDVLTGAWRRGPGLAELQREIDRARRGSGRLVVAYIDVDGLKATNDRSGHGAGDALLKRVVDAVQARVRSYEPIIRLGGDEFLCVLSGATIDNVRGRFDEIASELTATAGGGSITVGFAELAPGDTPADVINRADADLLAARGHT